MIDFHTHILPQMDDGSESVEQSVKMLQVMCDYGVEAVVATPHFDLQLESIEDFLVRRSKAFSALLAVWDGSVPIIPGAEVLYCGFSIHTVDGLDKLCFGNSRYLLIEPAIEYLGEAYYNDMMRLMSECNIVPVLAHIERYYYIGENRKWISRLRKEGAVLQMNAEAFLGWKRRKALKLMDKESVQILGSDCHNLENRMPNLASAVVCIQKHGNEKMMETLTAWGNELLRQC